MCPGLHRKQQHLRWYVLALHCHGPAAAGHLLSLQLDAAPEHDWHGLCHSDAARSRAAGSPAALQLRCGVRRQRAQVVAAVGEAARCLQSRTSCLQVALAAPKAVQPASLYRRWIKHILCIAGEAAWQAVTAVTWEDSARRR